DDGAVRDGAPEQAVARGRADPLHDGRPRLYGRSLALRCARRPVPGVGAPGSRRRDQEISISELSPRLIRPRWPVTEALSPMMECSSRTLSTRALALMMLSLMTALVTRAPSATVTSGPRTEPSTTAVAAIAEGGMITEPGIR